MITRQLPWHLGLSPSEAAARLGSFLGLTQLIPGEVVVMSTDQMSEILQRTSTFRPARDKKLEDALFAHANSVTRRFFHDEVVMRGIVEFSNVCDRDCFYCGIRKHQRVPRYTMSSAEVIDAAVWAYQHGIHTIMLQSGELHGQTRHNYLLETIKEVRRRTIQLDTQRCCSTSTTDRCWLAGHPLPHLDGTATPWCPPIDWMVSSRNTSPFPSPIEDYLGTLHHHRWQSAMYQILHPLPPATGKDEEEEEEEEKEEEEDDVPRRASSAESDDDDIETDGNNDDDERQKKRHRQKQIQQSATRRW